MKAILKLLVGVSLSLVCVFTVAFGGPAGNHYVENEEAEIDSVLLKLASELNSKLPMMVDSQTQLDSTVGVNKVFRYNSTLVNYSSSEMSAAYIQNKLKENIINNVCTTEEMQVFVSNGITITYAYYGNKGKLITVISVPPASCN